MITPPDFTEFYLTHSIQETCLNYNIKKSTVHNIAKGLKIYKVPPKTTESFINQCKDKWPQYDYSNTKYINKYTKIKFTCNIHGPLEQNPAQHLKNGCYFCSGRGVSKHTNESFIKLANSIHNNYYNYSKMQYKNMNSKIDIICPLHGLFQQKACNHIHLKNGCPKCKGGIKLTNKEYQDKANKLHNNKFSYIDEYQKAHDKITIICPIHGNFKQYAYLHLQTKHACPRCAAEFTISSAENEIVEFIKTFYNKKIEQSNRELLNGQEIDIYLPEDLIGIEYNGLYWHRESIIGRNYHLNKLNLSIKNNIKLIQIFENEWQNKQEIVKSRIKGILGFNNKIYARKCNIIKIDYYVKKEFLERTHIQGNDSSSIYYGLEFNGNLVAVMTFGKYRFKNIDCWELIRYSSDLNINIVGGASKLLNTFKKQASGNIVSFADRRWSNGNLYAKLGFTLDCTTKPNYFYYNTQNKTILSRMACQKNKLIKQGYSSNLSEYDIMKSRDFDRVWDCGNLRFKLWE